MHILVTNDDGVNAPGLLALVQEMRKLGQVTVLAPDHNWSASGHVKTLHRPLRVRDVTLADGTPALASDGAPSDCVALGVLGLLPEKIDMVVSGINSGPNLGHDVTYSGTVTAAMEAAIWGLAGVAVSLDVPENHSGTIDYGPAACFAYRIARAVAGNGGLTENGDSETHASDVPRPGYRLPRDVLLNVNVPYLPEDQIKGFRITRLGLRVYNDRLDARKDPRGRPYYWIGGEAPGGVPDAGTDFGALAEGAVSITPLHLDLTAYQAMPGLSTWDL
jgi:5'-nucleotidase